MEDMPKLLSKMNYAAFQGPIWEAGNHALNKAAFALGRLVGGGLLDQLEVKNALEEAALSIGLEEQETEATITSGMEAGISQPRIAQDTGPSSKKPQEPVKGSEWVPTLRTGAEIQGLDIKIEWLVDGILPKKAVSLLFGRGGISRDHACVTVI